MDASALSLAAYRVARPLLFRFDPERIHRLTIRGLRVAGEDRIGRLLLGQVGAGPRDPEPVRVAGMALRNRIGLGAGFDKDGVALRGWAALGLGFVEVGTVTPLPQPGNPPLRLFRLKADGALINRMGFNNAGAAELARHVMLARPHLPGGFAVGVNIGRGRDTPPEAAADDYAAAFRLVAPVADYVTVNISSPNTPGLRSMQSSGTVAALLTVLAEVGQHLNAPRPIFVKLAPDLDDETLCALAAAAADSGAAGLVLANTTLGRRGLTAARDVRDQAGGLSGRPLLPRAREAVGLVRAALGGRLAIIASGGVESGRDAAALIAAGADLVQLWTGLVFRGPGLIGESIRATAGAGPSTPGTTGLAAGLPGHDARLLR